VSRAAILKYCLAKPGAWLDEPWEGDEVVKVADKVFAFFGSPDSGSVSLKCGRTAEDAREWRDQYPDDVTVTAYIGRYGWNRFTIGGAVPGDELRELVDRSYADVVARLPKSKRPG
jgi:predicted DNA-binding protein (MmcQ/YjbR family)